MTFKYEERYYPLISDFIENKMKDWDGCPLCKHKEFTIASSVGELPSILPGQCYIIAIVVCDNCKYMFNFHVPSIVKTFPETPSKIIKIKDWFKRK